MSTEMVILIIGTILILLSIADIIKIKESTLGLMNPKMRIAMGMLGFLLLIYGGFSYGSVNLQGQIEQAEVGEKLTIQYPVERVQIISPVEGEAVKCRVLTMGVYPESNNNDLWVLLKPSDNKYYPQSDHTNTSYKRDGEWQVITRFGGDKDELFEIIVYETDPAASQFFSTTIEDWKESLSFPGLELEDLPTGSTEVDRISVSLQNDCRGVF